MDSNDLKTLAAAYEDGDVTDAERDRDRAPVYIIPKVWTAVHVCHRMVEAFEVAHYSISRPGPRSHANAWPAMVTEWADLVDEDLRERMTSHMGARQKDLVNWEYYVDAQTRRQLESDAAEEARRRPPRLVALAIEMADEALQWASIYLADWPTRADALQIWAFAKARNHDMERMLAARRLAARSLADRQTRELTAIREVRRREIVREATNWANARLASASTPERRDRIRSNALIRAARTIEAEGLNATIQVRLQDVMPGKVFAYPSLNAWRKEASAYLADALQKAKVIVR